MKKLFVLLISLSFFASNANSQVKKEANPSQSSQRDTKQKKKKKDKLKDLNLTEAQQQQVKRNPGVNETKKEDINKDKTLTAAQKKAKLKELHKEKKQKIDAVLTPEQREKKEGAKKEIEEVAGVSTES